MTDKWDFYFCRVDDQPASIFVDLGIAGDAPMRTLPVMAYVRVFMRRPRPDGLSSNEDFEELKSIEDCLDQQLSSSTSVYVGRNTSNACRDFYFYTTATTSWKEDVSLALAAFADLRFESGTRDDPEWKAYLGFLHPSEEEMERIQNRRACEALENAGDKLAAERPIEHWAYFNQSTDRTAFIEKAEALGYKVLDTWPPDAESERFGVNVGASGIPSLQNIDDLTIPLWRAARECNGEYDGWETEVVRG
ncbi:DUF695 domain-containing protein [Solimonas marina]|uniref:DUF695 domain-containing protein n=1 Tax=Solimonas marina TaxID=2714601 RepID=A0A969W7B6_9GAMM|nr:DUF695 domain-containing protein [Solimonas marina]NKF20920.1 DUF695 domain-containing protein [Solimonas marina]